MFYKKDKMEDPIMKRSILVYIALFVAVAIVIPALIVLPFSEHKNPETTKVLAKTKKSQVKHDPDIAIPVMRHATKKVAHVGLRDYLIGVVASEMPAKFELEALKAQAIAARTYIARFMITAGADDAVSDTPEDQVYESRAELKKAWGATYRQKMKKITEAVDQTAGLVLTYKGDLISPSFFSTSNGYTENAEAYWQKPVPYLKSVKSTWDESSPKFLRTVEKPVSEVEEKLGVHLPIQNGTVGTILSRTPGKRVAEFKIGGVVFTGRQIREKLNLYSADFKMERIGSKVKITTKGYGHGIGMSQYGANGMAKEGKSCEDILKYYYRGVTLSKLSDFIK
jgi:stage II sporulation protein D